MSECIQYERNRIGGDWVIAHAVPSRTMRNVIQKVLGTDLIFIILSLEKETTLQRLRKRHGGEDFSSEVTEMCIRLESCYELKGKDEMNTFLLFVVQIKRIKWFDFLI